MNSKIDYFKRSLVLGSVLGIALVHSTAALAQESGDFILPNEGDSFTDNILVSATLGEVTDSQRVFVQFSGSESEIVLCSSTCPTDTPITRGGINPSLYGVQPGDTEISLWIGDDSTTTMLAQRSISWNAPDVAGVTLTRGADQTQLDVSWESVSGAIRYNVYLAAQSGVSRSTYKSLEDGQAKLGLASTSHSFSGLNNRADYYVLVTALNSTGEFSLASEQSSLVANDPPVAVNDSASTDEDTSVLIDVLANDTDPDGDTLTIFSVVSGSSGSATISGSQISFTPASNFNGQTQFTYVINDGRVNSESATVTVEVSPVNDVPVASADEFSAEQGENVSLDVLSNDTDVDGDSLTITAVSSSSGSVSILSDNTLSYTAPTDLVGTDEFTYTISDGNSGEATGNVTVTVSEPVNDPPVAVDDEFSVPQGETVTLDVLANDTDDEGDSLTITSVSAGSGSVSILSDNTLSYTAPGDLVGLDEFSYTISDGTSEATANVSITVTEVLNVAPVAVDDTATTDEDVSVLIDVLANDTDADDDALTVTSATTENGVAVIEQNQVNYTPEENFNGEVTVDYEISDGQGNIASAVITITINPVNDAPITVDDTFEVVEGQSLVLDVLANDSDIEEDELTITATSSSNGTVTILSDNTLDYLATSGFTGLDEFTYTVSDGNDGETIGNVSVTVTAAPVPPPITNDDTYSAAADTQLVINAANGLLANDASSSGLAITADTSLVTEPSNGLAIVSSDGSFTYTPNSGFTGSDTFAYNATDENGGTTQGQVTISVQSITTDLTGDSQSITGQFLYIGQGDVGGGTGSGSYRIGSCSQGTDTVCTMRGTYTESSSSGNNPGGTGDYVFTQTYSGTGDSPVIAQSDSPGSNFVTFTDLGDAVFELKLYPDSDTFTSGSLTYVNATLPDGQSSNTLGFGAFISSGETCENLSSGTCSIGNVGLNAGSSLTASLSSLNFTVPSSKTALPSNDTASATDDSYAVTGGQQFSVSTPGVMSNDTPLESVTYGYVLEEVREVSFGSDVLVGLAYAEDTRLFHIYEDSSVNANSYDVTGFNVATWDIRSEVASNADIDIAPEVIEMAGSTVGRGLSLFVNGQTGTAEILAIDVSQLSLVVAELSTGFGNGNVVGGAYNPVTKSFFLVQNNAASTDANTIAEVDAASGAVLNTFSIASSFDVASGDLAVNLRTGNLLVVSSSESQIAEFDTQGSLVRKIDLPSGVSNLSGIGVDREGDRIFVSSTSGSVYELGFTNDGVWPRWKAELVEDVTSGTLTLDIDGSFTYTPNTGFTGQDSFVYKLTDSNGRFSLATVILDVN